MNNPYTPLRVTLNGRFAAALRLAAATDRRTITAFLETYLPVIGPYTDADALLTAQEKAKEVPAVAMLVPPVIPPAPMATPTMVTLANGQQVLLSDMTD